MLNYASTDPLCIRAVFSYFMEYMPYIILLQTLFLIVVEKFSFKIPKVFQKVERFYTNIVEESLFGKDPDVAEDMTDPKSRTDAMRSGWVRLRSPEIQSLFPRISLKCPQFS